MPECYECGVVTDVTYPVDGEPHCQDCCERKLRLRPRRFPMKGRLVQPFDEAADHAATEARQRIVDNRRSDRAGPQI